MMVVMMVVVMMVMVVVVVVVAVSDVVVLVVVLAAVVVVVVTMVVVDVLVVRSAMRFFLCWWWFVWCVVVSTVVGVMCVMTVAVVVAMLVCTSVCWRRYVRRRLSVCGALGGRLRSVACDIRGSRACVCEDVANTSDASDVERAAANGLVAIAPGGLRTRVCRRRRRSFPMPRGCVFHAVAIVTARFHYMVWGTWGVVWFLLQLVILRCADS